MVRRLVACGVDGEHRGGSGGARSPSFGGAMPEAEHTVRIHRPPAAVFAYFADGENDPQWRPAVKEIARNGPIGPGMTYRQRVAGPGGRPIPSDFRVTAYEPDSHLAFEVTA